MNIKVATYLFVSLYVLAMLRPILPLLDYAINYDYISKVLCVNKEKVKSTCKGKCYVKKQLEEQKENSPSSFRIAIEDYPIGFIELAPILQQKSVVNELKKPWFFVGNYTYLICVSVFRPPTN